MLVGTVQNPLNTYAVDSVWSLCILSFNSALDRIRKS